MGWNWNPNDTFAVAARRGWSFLVVGFAAVLVFRFLQNLHLSVALVGVVLVCYIGFRVEGRLFGYGGHEDPSVKLAFASVMAVQFAAGWNLWQGGSWWLGGGIYVLLATLYHAWLMNRCSTDLPPILWNHWRTLRRAFKPKHSQADMLRTRAVGLGEIGESQLALRVLVDGQAVEIHAEAIPGSPISIPWSEIECFRAEPRGDAVELRAHIRVRQFPNMPIVVPWLAEFAQFAPKLAS